jgi:two-component sensor histidine kinase
VTHQKRRSKIEGAGQAQKGTLLEQQHRIKNLMAVVSSIVMQSLSAAKSLDDARIAVRYRLDALSVTHDLLWDTHCERAPLDRILAAAIAPFNLGDRIKGQYVNCEIPSSPALNIALLINELCTNAQKYGALSVPGGSVELNATADAGILNIRWKEKGGPPVRPPSTSGFGTKMIRLSHPTFQTKLEFPFEGVVCEIEISLPA